MVQKTEKGSSNRPISLHKRSYSGTVTSTKSHKTATVSWTRRVYIPKYERYEKRATKVKAHIPDELKLHEGDIVRIQETRPISKTKSFIITEIIGKSKEFELEGKEAMVSEAPENKKESNPEENETNQSKDN